MKLASLKEGGRDGRLVVVSRELKKAVRALAAATLQGALDDWDTAGPRLRAEYERLNAGQSADSFAFDPDLCTAPLPRAYQWADGSAYVHHIELVRQARGAEMPPHFWIDPLMYQGGSDVLLGPRDPIEVEREDWGIDFEAEIAVVTGDVPMAVDEASAGRHIHLLMLVNDVSLRNLIPHELAKGFGFFQSKPASAFAPVAITLEEAGAAWNGQQLCLPVTCRINEVCFGQPDAGRDMTFGFPRLIAHAARTRRLAAGCIIGSGTISNCQSAGEASVGSACIAERRTIETIETGGPATPFLRFGDRVRIEVFDRDGLSLFGAIDQVVAPYQPPSGGA